MKASVLLSAIVVLAACQGNTDKKVTSRPDTAVTAEPITPVTICFQRLEGSSRQDTAFVHLVISGNNVQGDFLHKPFEKDARKGTIKGTKQGDQIKGVWTYMQEGMQDSLLVAFKLADGKLFQKSYSVDIKTGQQFLSDTSRYVLEFDTVACDKIDE